MKLFLSSAACLLGLLWAAALPAADERDTHREWYRQGQELERQGQTGQALDLYRKAIEHSRAQWPEDAAAIAFWMGGVYRQQERFAEAGKAFQDSLAWREQVLGKEHGAVAVSLDALAGLYFTLGDYAQAEPLYQRALAIDEKLSGADSRQAAMRLNNLGEVYRVTGDLAQAEKLLQRALAIEEKVSGPNTTRVGIRLNNLAEIYRLKGDYAQAESLLQRALEIEEKALAAQETDPANLGIRLNNLGQVYRTVGHFSRAEPYYRKALEIWEKTPGPESALSAAGLNNLGWLAYAQGRYPEAEGFYQRALKIYQKAYGLLHPEVARLFNNLAVLYAAQQRYDEAAPLYQRALQIWEKTEQQAEVASVLHNQARLYRERGLLSQAEKALQRALPIAEANDQPALLWAVLDNLSQLLLAQEQPEAAILVGKQAVNLLQRLRLNIAQMGRDLQKSFIQDKGAVYQRLADLLLSQGRNGEAQEVLRMLKEEEYHDFLRRDSSAQARQVRARYNEREQPWAERAEQLSRELNETGHALRMIRVQVKLDPARQPQQVKVEQQLAGVMQAFVSYLQELKAAFRQHQEEAAVQLADSLQDRELAALAREFHGLRYREDLSAAEKARKDELRKLLIQANLSFNLCLADLATQQRFQDKNLDTLRALQGTLEELGHGAVLVNYLITPDKLRILLTSPELQVCREAPVGEEELEAAIAAFRESLSYPPHPVPAVQRREHARLLAQAQTLHGWLFGPIAGDLRELKAETLMLSLDGRLRYLPVAALHDGQAYVAERYQLVMFTEAARDKLKDPPKPDWRVAGLGLTEALSGFNPLPTVAEELDGIVKRDPQDRGVLPGLIRLNREFDQDSLLEVLDYRYPVLHIASHFVFQPSTDQDSFLLMGDGSELSLARIRLAYDFNGIDLLTLSACQTAVGSTTKGQEVEGFGALAQKQGAKSVLATLWPVDDRSTGVFMQHLYRVHTEQSGLTKAAALRQAQQAFIQASGWHGKPEAYPYEYRYPYYWAPFIMMGNWL